MSNFSVEPSFSPSLDQSQLDFCTKDDVPVRLLAPAGSGKTTSLLHRCRVLAEVSDKTKPRFLVLTFTRSARDELNDRLKNNPVFKDVAPLVSITTLNSWGFKLVKNVTTNPRLVTSNKDRHFCVQNVLQPAWKKYPAIKTLLEDKRRKSKAEQDLLHMIDWLKSMGFRHDTLSSLEEFVSHFQYLYNCGMETQLESFFKRILEMELIPSDIDSIQPIYESFIPFWREASDVLYRSALLTLEDQKYWARIELENQLAGKRFTTGGARYHHILIDEFQDINPLDLALLKAIAGVNKANLTIVGDDDQAIYEWRGATPGFILHPDQHLGGNYDTCILETNYRSPRNIVHLSQKLIVKNKRRVPKNVKAHQTVDAHVEIRKFSTISDAISNTVELVCALLDDSQCKNIALVSRKRSQIIPYQIVFAGQNIPFYAAEDLHVLLSGAFSEMKNMLVICGRKSSSAMIGGGPVQDILKLCDKVKRYPLSKVDRDNLIRHLYQHNPQNLKSAVLALYQYLGPLKGSNEGGRMSASFADAISELVDAETVSESILAISSNFEGLQKDYGKALEDIFYTDPPFLYLAEFAKRYKADFASFYNDIEKAIATLARVSPDDEENADKEPEWKRPLHLMTALRAKGKEFDAVIVLDANDGIWPSKLAKTDNDLEQERRLFYVAMTRARRYLYFIVNDSILDQVSKPSPYLAEMGMSTP